MKKKRAMLPMYIRQEILQVFRDNYFYIDNIKFEEFRDRVVSQACSANMLGTYVNEIKCDPYTSVSAVTSQSKTEQAEYVNLWQGILYIKLNDFCEVDSVIDIIRSQRCEHLLIDLAQNWGGNIHNMLQVAELLVPCEELAELRYRDGTKKLHRTSECSIGVPKITVFISEKTMSSGEILAYILREYHGNCRLFGKKTFGKGMGQVTWSNAKYKIRCSVTAFQWLVNGMTCEELQDKYQREYIHMEYDRNQYIGLALQEDEASRKSEGEH